MRPICTNCSRFFRPKKTGVYFEECRRGENGEPAPYKLWSGDLWECDCGAQIIVGVGRESIAEHFQADYSDWVRSLKPTLRVVE